MNATPPLMLEPETSSTVSGMMLAGLGIFWAVLMLAAFRSRLNIDGDISVLLVMSCGYALLIAWKLGRTLSEGAHVLGQRRAPASLWSDWSRAAMRNATRLWIALSLGMTALVLTPPSTTPWPVPAALLSLTLVIGTVRSLAHGGMLARGWQIAIDIGAALLLAFVLIVQHDALREQLSALPAWPLLAVVAAWPLLAWTLARLWRDEPRRRRWSAQPRSRGTLFNFVRSHLLRYSSLGWTEAGWLRKNSGQNLIHKNRLVQLFSGMPMVMVSVFTWGAATWGQPVLPRHMAMLGFLCIFMSANLLARDLHWRLLLVPGGLHRGRIGFHIFVSTMRMNLICTAIACLVVLLGTAIVGASIPAMLRLYLRYSVFIFELAFVVGAALIVRVLPYSAFITPALFGLLCWLSIRLHVAPFMYIAGAPGDTLVAGWPYALGLMVGTGAFIVIANLLWTPKKLFAFSKLGY